MNENVPDRNSWYRVEARSGTAFSAREQWCQKNCQQRWIFLTGTKIAEFDSDRDMVAFFMTWG